MKHKVFLNGRFLCWMFGSVEDVKDRMLKEKRAKLDKEWAGSTTSQTTESKLYFVGDEVNAVIDAVEAWRTVAREEHGFVPAGEV